jgi:DNA-directed RNA polymerase subunit L
MTNQYKNMEYEIKDEIIEDDNAVVEVEVTVYDYASALKNANTYLNEHLDEFKADVKDAVEDAKDAVEDAVDNDNEVSTDTDTSSDSDYDEDKFMDYKISEMEKVKDTTKYTIEFTLTKVNDEWQLDDLSNSDIEKLHGIYIS